MLIWCWKRICNLFLVIWAACEYMNAQGNFPLGCLESKNAPNICGLFAAERAPSSPLQQRLFSRLYLIFLNLGWNILNLAG